MNFIEALSTDNLTSIRAAPKTDVHSHAFLSTRLENLERWLGQPLKHPPSKMKGLAGMMEYINEVLSHHIITPESFKFVASSGVRDAIQDGVVVLELKNWTIFGACPSKAILKLLPYASGLDK